MASCELKEFMRTSSPMGSAGSSRSADLHDAPNWGLDLKLSVESCSESSECSKESSSSSSEFGGLRTELVKMVSSGAMPGLSAANLQSMLQNKKQSDPKVEQRYAQARRASLQRFLERRKERVREAAPFKTTK